MVIVRGGWRGVVGMTAAGLVAAVALAGCGADAGSDTATSDGAPAGAPQAGGFAQDDKAGAAPREAETDANGQAGGAPAKYRVDARSIIYNGSITVRVKDPDAQAQRAVEVATGAGGFVGSDQRTSDDDRSQATLELRVPAERFTQVVKQLAELGEEESRSISTQDVTEQVVDLDARIATQQASVARTRTLLAQANSIAEIVSVEGELSKREADLSSLQAKKRRLADLTSLSTITLVLLAPAAAVAEEESDTGFVAGVKSGWKAFLASMEVLLTIFGALLPWLVALGVPIYALIWVLRRIGRRQTRPVPAPVPVPAAAGPPAPQPPNAPQER